MPTAPELPLEPDIRTIEPPQISIVGSGPAPRTFHRDDRGFLIETLRSDDAAVEGSRFRMTYTSLTLPHQYRDVDRWHVHRIQTDRFVVVLGEMTLALFDSRESSPSRGRLEVIRMKGGSWAPVRSARVPNPVGHLVPIPPGVLHCIGNLSDEPFLLENFPTELYSPADEGRVPFSEVPVDTARRPFDWKRVVRRPAPD